MNRRMTVLLLLSGCAGSKGLVLDSASSETGDSAADTATDSGGDTVDTGLPPCGTYNHVGHVGSVTEWIYTMGGGSTTTATGWDPTTGAATSTSVGQSTGPGYTEVAQGEAEARCDSDGLWAVHEHAEWTRMSDDGVASTGWTDRVFDHALLAPAVLEVGVSWGETSTTTTTEEVDGVVQEPVVEKNEGTFTVTQATTVTVVGGTFDVLQVDGTVRGNATTFYLADGIGAVKNAGGELSSYTE